MPLSKRLPTEKDLQSWLYEKNNWGRWGKDDQKGAVNLITPKKRAAAAKLVRSGRIVSLTRDLAKAPAPNNARPVQHYMKAHQSVGYGSSGDYIGIYFHGYANTHLDALSHFWGKDGIYNGGDPKKHVTFDGATWGGVEAWAEGIVTRGVLIDIPKFRKKPFVTLETPVHGWELEAAAKAQGVTLDPGDALVIYSGRENWQRANPGLGYAQGGPAGKTPGLHASCLEFFKAYDAAVLVWDMMDATPSGYSLGVPLHGAIFAYGMAFVDNALLEPLAKACVEEKRYDFMVSLAPLRLIGGTGGPINPLALF